MGEDIGDFFVAGGPEEPGAEVEGDAFEAGVFGGDFGLSVFLLVHFETDYLNRGILTTLPSSITINCTDSMGLMNQSVLTLLLLHVG